MMKKVIAGLALVAASFSGTAAAEGMSLEEALANSLKAQTAQVKQQIVQQNKSGYDYALAALQHLVPQRYVVVAQVAATEQRKQDKAQSRGE
ncbi:hypothetical protein [Pseudidiomarina salilacus]|uniref:hypothetical protein n=1 Tax=Pseudidiomarina salilacus TaxID=3384452 RepID=UPI0039851750